MNAETFRARKKDKEAREQRARIETAIMLFDSEVLEAYESEEDFIVVDIMQCVSKEVIDHAVGLGFVLEESDVNGETVRLVFV